MGGMLGLEISVNGQHVRTIAIGDRAALNADVMWVHLPTREGDIREYFRIHPSGYDGKTSEGVRWPHIELQRGDVVSVRLIEVEGPSDPPIRRISPNERDERIAAHHRGESP